MTPADSKYETAKEEEEKLYSGNGWGKF